VRYDLILAHPWKMAMQKLGRYEILEEIGRGGFGRVYRAHDPTMKRTVAIKVMSSTEDPDHLARFRNEAASTGHLAHDNIITVFDIGEEAGLPYIVMEYLQGMDLQQFHDRNVPLSLLEKVRILCQIAAGLEAAHARGVIHRDVKPANIMILKDGSVKIMDFGIAHLSEENVTRLTRTGMVLGTLQYIPPEQFEGHPVDALTDLWGFGVIAFQLLSGHNPFEGHDTASVIYRITSRQVPDIREISPAIPADLAAVVSKLLQRERGARFQSFEDVRIELSPMLERLEMLDDERLVEQAQAVAVQGAWQAANQILRQVLDRHPSNVPARQLRDQVVAQLRAIEIKQQVEDSIRKGDEQMAQSRFEEAVSSYSQACRINPQNTTARLRLDRATDLAERERRTRAELNEAKAQLLAGTPRDAQRILAVILAGDPENAEAALLKPLIDDAVEKQDLAARTGAILRASVLASNDQFDEAISMLRAAIAQIGDHPDLRRVEEEIRQAAKARVEQVLIDEQLSKANRLIRQGHYREALELLAPLARTYPEHEGIREAAGRANAEHARRAARETAAGLTRLPLPPPVQTLPVQIPLVQAPPVQLPQVQPPDEATQAIQPSTVRQPALEPPVSLASAAIQPSPSPPLPARSSRMPAYLIVAGAIVCLLGAGLYVSRPRPPHPAAGEVTTNKTPEPVPIPPPPQVETPVQVVKPTEEAKAPVPETKKLPEEVKAPKKEAVPPPKAQPKSVDTTPVPSASPPSPKPVVEPAPPKASGQPPLANTPITPEPWGGQRKGTANWRGTLEPGARLVLGTSATGILEGSGQLRVTGGFLPTEDFGVTGLTPELSLQVFAATRLQRVVITNNSSSPVTSLSFSWELKK
jgi:serine/threonine protein kinase